MNNKLYALMLTAPLLFSACNSTSVSPKIEKKEVTIQESLPETKMQAIPSSSSKVISVTYANDKKFIKDQGMMNIESFMETLKPTLMGLMQSDPSHKTALGGCSSMAQGMTDDYNKISDVKIRRTALKYRNPKNRPDETDTVVMEQFISAQKLNEPLVIEMPDHYRVYKPLIMKQPCMACHGDNISKDIQEMTTKLYPKDMATGFKLGEFRGVVVAKVKK